MRTKFVKWVAYIDENIDIELKKCAYLLAHNKVVKEPTKSQVTKFALYNLLANIRLLQEISVNTQGDGNAKKKQEQNINRGTTTTDSKPRTDEKAKI